MRRYDVSIAKQTLQWTLPGTKEGEEMRSREKNIDSRYSGRKKVAA